VCVVGNLDMPEILEIVNRLVRTGSLVESSNQWGGCIVPYKTTYKFQPDRPGFLNSKTIPSPQET